MLRTSAILLCTLAFMGGGVTAAVCLFLCERHPNSRYTRDEVYGSRYQLPDPEMLTATGRRLWRIGVRSGVIAAVGGVLAIFIATFPR